MSYYMPELDCTSITSQLNHLSNDDLKHLLNDENNQRWDEMINDLQQVKSLERERDLLIESNKGLAEHNLSREPTYRHSRQLLIDGHNELKTIKEEVDKKKCRLSEVSRQTSLDTTLALLQTATAQAEEESEDMARAFLLNEMSFDSFIKGFIDKRKLSHLRRIKTEKMMECVRSDNNRVNNSNTSSSPFQPLRPAPPPPSLPFAGHNPLPPYPMFDPQMMPQHHQQQQQPINYPYNRNYR